MNLAGLAANGPAWCLLASGTVNNQIKDVGYDVAGNQTQYLVNNAQRVADYDGEGRIWRVRETGKPQTLEVSARPRSRRKQLAPCHPHRHRHFQPGYPPLIKAPP